MFIYIYPWNIFRRSKSKIETNVKVGKRQFTESDVENELFTNEIFVIETFTIPLNFPPKLFSTKHPVYAQTVWAQTKKKKIQRIISNVFFESFG